MPRSRFLNTPLAPSSRDVPKPKTHPRIQMSKEARAVLKENRHQASEKYQRALIEAYGNLEQQIQVISSAHHKSAQRVRSDLHMGPQISMNRHSRKSAWNAFCWKKSKDRGSHGKKGKEVLQDLVQNLKQEYASLTQGEKENLVSELEKAKATKAKGFHLSARSRTNDVTKTLGVLENEIDNLRSRCGIEAILLMTRGSTKTPLNNLSFATPGVTQFLGTVFKIDNHDLLTRMEGFAIQGLKGTASNYKQMVTQRRSEIRAEISKQLRIVTGNENARMEWKYYWAKVVARYNVVIEGWPISRIPLKNLSEASSPLADLNTLLQQWRDGTTYWKTITSDEVEKLLDEQRAKGEALEPPPRCTRSDRGKKRKRDSTSPSMDKSRKRRKTAIRSATVSGDSESSDNHGSDTDSGE